MKSFEDGYFESRKHERLVIFMLIILLFATILISLTIGRYSLTIPEIYQIFRDKILHETTSVKNNGNVVMFVVRIPRIALAIMVGGSIAVAGASYQGIFKNPMVSQDILGASNGAATGAVIAMLISASSVTMQIMSFSMGVFAVMLVLFVTKLVNRGNGTLLVMLLSGTVVSSIFLSIMALLKYTADPDEKLPGITYWLMGSFARSNGIRDIVTMFIIMIIGITPLFLLRHKMNVLSFGDEEAKAMGINVRLVRTVVVLCATLLTAAAVSLCGVIAWVGLIIPHICRFLVGPNFRPLLPTTLLTGAIFMLVVDNFARGIIPGELPIGILTSLIGAPLFLFILFKQRGSLS